MATCSVYKIPVLLGTGTISNGDTEVASYTGVAVGTGRNIQLMITSSTDAGKWFPVRVSADGGTTLTTTIANPFAT